MVAGLGTGHDGPTGFSWSLWTFAPQGRNASRIEQRNGKGRGEHVPPCWIWEFPVGSAFLLSESAHGFSFAVEFENLRQKTVTTIVHIVSRLNRCRPESALPKRSAELQFPRVWV